MKTQTIELPIVSLTFQGDMEVVQHETWKPLDDPTIAPYYEVSQDGEIREITHDTTYTRLGREQTRHVEKHLVKQHTNNSGYSIVGLQGKNGKTITRTVQQLVATAWLEKPNTAEKLEVDHINGNRQDNRADNLQYLTVSQNRKKRVTPENKYQGKKS